MPSSIIVKNGNVTLYGVVNNQGDAAISYMQANSTPWSLQRRQRPRGSGCPPNLNRSLSGASSQAAIRCAIRSG